jgi:CRP/FNR family transcriptional regulator, cyclic AMP receptor protein
VGQDRAESLLAQTRLFAGLDPSALATLAAEGHERSYKRHAPIFHEGEPGDAFFVIMSGAVKVYVTSAQGAEMVLTTVRSPGTLGEVSLFDEGPRSASAEAMEPVRLLTFARSTVLGLAARDPRISEALLRAVGDLLRRLTTQAADLVFLDLEGRVAKLIADSAEARGRPDADTLVLDLGFTQGELASMVGGSRQSVNQILGALEGRGFLEVDRDTIVVKDLAALRRRAAM